MKKHFFLAVIVALFSCKEEGSSYKTIRGNAIGTTFNIHYSDSANRSFETKIDSLIAAVNKSVSTYIPTSDISRVNKGDTTVVIDAYFDEIFKKATKIYNETQGDFDPTVGILVNAWGFGPEKPVKNLDSTKIKQLLTYVGFNKVRVVTKKVVKDYPEIYLDFNSIAKGYLVDVIGRMFETEGIKDYLVEIGGEIRARGKNEKGVYWKIAIENPNEDGTRSFATVIQLKDESIATSGNYRKYKIAANGKKYVHTINAKTGYATESNLLSASVISKSDCADVDGYATAFMAMGFKKTKVFLEAHKELKAFLIFVDSEGKMQTFKSENFDN